MAPLLITCGRKPNRPKRPLTAYITFMKKFLRAQCIKSKREAQKAVIAGAKRWNQMSDSEKSKYGKSCAKLRLQYLTEKAEYIRQMKAMKAPPRPYGAFVANYCKESSLNGKRLNFAELSREAGCAWRSLPQSEKDKYRTDFYQQYDDFCRRLAEDQNQRNSGYNSGEFVARAGNPSLFNLRRIRRERHRELLQQKLQLQRQEPFRSSPSQPGEGRSIILQQDANNSSNNSTNSNIVDREAADASGKAKGSPNNNDANKSPGSSQNSSNSESREDRALRRLKAREARDESSSSKAGKNEKHVKLSSKDKHSSRGARAQDADKKNHKNRGAKQSGGKSSFLESTARNKRR